MRYHREALVGSCEKLLDRARRSPAGLAFGELCALAECFGWVLVRTRGSHHLYKRPQSGGLMNFQSFRGKAVPYQVRQLLRAIEAPSATEDA